MAFSPTQLVSMSGFMQGKGLQINANLVSQLNTVESTDRLSGLLRKIANEKNADPAVVTAMRTQLPGFSLTVPISYGDDLPKGLVTTDVPESVRARAQAIMAKGVKGFLTAFSSAAASSATAFDILGSAQGITAAGFSGMAPGVNNYTDQLTGGLSSKFGPGAPGSDAASASQFNLGAAAKAGLGVIVAASAVQSQILKAVSNPATIVAGIAAIGFAVKNLGTLYDVKKPTSIGDPIALVQNLDQQGLVTSTSLGANLANNGVDTTDLANADPVLVTASLKQVTGSDLDKIITETKLKLPAGVKLNTGDEFLSSSKLLGGTALAAIPGGSLAALGSQLSNLGAKFNNPADAATTLSKVEVPNLPAVTSLTSPLPDADVSLISGTLPKGKGTFGNPTVQDMLGTAAGHVHNDALFDIIDGQDSLANLTTFSELFDAARTYDTAYAAFVADELGMEPAPDPAPLIAAIEALAADGFAEEYVTKTDEAVAKMVDQLILELDNCDKAGVDVNAVVPGNNTVIASASKLGSYGADKNELGTASMLSAMASDDLYGQAMQAAMLESRNASLLQKLGLPQLGLPDPSALAKLGKASKGEGLTQLQKDNIIAEAKSREVAPDQALSNSSLFGYNSKFYEDKGYPPA